MIVELLRVAKGLGLSGHENVRKRRVHWFIELNANGHVLGFSPTTAIVENREGKQKERRGKVFKVPANYHMQWKGNTIQSVCTNQHNWLPDFLTGPANEIFRGGVNGKNPFAHKQALWEKLVVEATRDLPNNETVRAVAKFLEERPQFSALPIDRSDDDAYQRLLKDLDARNETISFRVCGRLAVADHELRAWWAERVDKQRQEVVARLRSGVDGFLPEEGPITEYFPTVFGNVPFASFNKAPFVSYGLGSQTATFRLETAEKSAAALNALLHDRNSNLQLGDEVAVFWAVERQTGRQQSADFLILLDQPDPLAVRDYLRGVWGARQPHLNTTDFHVVILLEGTGRFSVRSWHTDTLASAERHVHDYFTTIQLAGGQDETIALRDLAWATIGKVRGQKTKPTSAVFNAVFLAAWRGAPIPYSVFAAVIQRQKLEMAGRDTANKEFGKRLGARTALIQLYFALGKNFSPTEERIMNTKDTAILCGRLLALLDKIHEVAHSGKNASSPANRLYGAASATPALVFPRLCQLARYHLQKMDGGMAYKLEFGVAKDRREDGVPEDFEGLAAIVARLNEVSEGNFPRLLSLEDQGRFALGFYHERNRRWPNFKDGTHGVSNPERSSV